jgi:antitoxin (DNA-binding transcriptional repressor) of toxin-antitoxin stability system
LGAEELRNYGRPIETLAASPVCTQKILYWTNLSTFLRICDSIELVGLTNLSEETMKTIGAFEAKTHLSRYLSDVSKKGEEIVILRRGRTMAVLAPYDHLFDRANQARSKRVVQGLRDVRAAYKAGPPLRVKELIEEGRRP